MSIRRTLSFLLLIAFLLLVPSLAPAQTLDQYGGYKDMPVPGGATGRFRVAKLNNAGSSQLPKECLLAHWRLRRQHGP